MPDVTVSFTDAQWERIVAASESVIGVNQGTVDVDNLSTLLKDMVSSWVKEYEQRNTLIEDF